MFLVNAKGYVTIKIEAGFNMFRKFTVFNQSKFGYCSLPCVLHRMCNAYARIKKCVYSK